MSLSQEDCILHKYGGERKPVVEQDFHERKESSKIFPIMGKVVDCFPLSKTQKGIDDF